MLPVPSKNQLPVILSVTVVAVIFLLSLITFHVDLTEYAVVLRFGKPLSHRETSPGLHGKLPFETVWKIDKRIRTFAGKEGVLEEVFTRDEKNIIVSTFIGWKINEDRVVFFLERVGSIDQAEKSLTSLLRNYRNAVIGNYLFSDLIDTNPDNVKISIIENEILRYIKEDAYRLFGIDVVFLGIKHIGFPEAVTARVFERMRAERENEVQNIISKGESLSTKIRATADKEYAQSIAEAESKAKQIRAEGDAQAAKHYAVFQKNPELALFLRKLESLKKILSEQSVLILDTNTIPFDLLKKDTLDGYKEGKAIEKIP